MATPAAADVKLPSVFTDHMVLQRNIPVRVFGMAQPNESVTVELRDGSGGPPVRSAKVLANTDGHWSVTMEALPASAKPMQLVVTAANTLTVNDVVVGEVWVAGGQSNMEWTISGTGTQVAAALAEADDPDIRILKVPHATANRPQFNIQAEWVTLGPQTVNDFSAVAFWFAVDLKKKLGVPIGILSINWGGTRAEPWVDLVTLATHPRYEAEVARQRARVEIWDSTPEALRDKEWNVTWAEYQRSANNWWKAVNNADPGAKAKWYAASADPKAGEDGWNAGTLPQKWSAVPELAGFDGVVWYRRMVEIPAEWSGKACMLEMGPVDDGDVAYFNGRAVANTINNWTSERRYVIPGDLVKPGAALIALEVVDLHGEGGMVSGPVLLRCKEAGDAVIALDGEWLWKKGGAAADLPKPPDRPMPESAPATRSTDMAALFNAMIAPFAGYGVRGAIWYQGESNANSMEEAQAYRDLLPLVARSWRTAFERPDMPFGVVSLAAFHDHQPDVATAGVWPELRDAQLSLEMQVPNAGVIPTIDVGDARDIHPRDKKAVGGRLARWALATTYDQQKVSWRGPRVMRVRTDKDGLIVEFEVERPPLTLRNGTQLGGFAIAGEDGVFYRAEAFIATPTTVRLKCPEVKKPVEIRYGWQDNPQDANLMDASGELSLPAHPFRIKVGNS